MPHTLANATLPPVGPLTPLGERRSAKFGRLEFWGLIKEPLTINHSYMRIYELRNMAAEAQVGSGERQSVIHRWGVTMARYRRLVLAVWAGLLVACAIAYPLLEDRLGAPDFGVTGSESAEVDRLMATHFPELGAEQDVIVFWSESGTIEDSGYQETVDRALAAAAVAAAVAAAAVALASR